MRTIAVLALLVTSSVFASEIGLKKVYFSVGGMGGMSTTYYNCDSVRDTVRGLIEKLGGTSVSVNCSGGLDTFGNMSAMPAYVSATFDNYVSGGSESETMTLKSRFDANCELNVTALNAILPQFDNIEVLHSNASCFDNRTRWSYDLKITK